MADEVFNTETNIDNESAIHRPLSDVLRELVASSSSGHTIAAITDAIAGRSLGAVLAFFAAINLIPLPPGTSVVLGLPIVLISAQLLLAQKSIWLPRRISLHFVEQAVLSRTLESGLPWILWMEKFLKPRYWPFSTRGGEVFVGAAGLLLGLIVVFPIPLGNAGPAFAVAILGLALSERDGFWLSAGLLIAIIATLVAGTVVVGAAYAASAAWHLGTY
jgi:hypothetical protein